MLLDQLLAHLGVTVQPFAVCRVRRGWRLAMAAAGEVHLHFVVAGGGALYANGAWTSAVRPYSLVVVPPSVAHRFEPDPDGEVRFEQLVDAATCSAVRGGLAEIGGEDESAALEMLCGRLIVGYGGAAGLFDALRAPLVVDFDDAPAVQRVFDVLIAEQRQMRPGGVRMMELLMEQCLIHLFRELCHREPCQLPWLAALEHPGFARVLSAVLDEPSQPHTLDSLATLAGMSRSVFSERFAAAFGRSAVELVRETRLRRAAELLRTTDLPVKAIAAKVGFSSRSHFSRAFKSLFRRDPAHYRGLDAGA